MINESMTFLGVVDSISNLPKDARPGDTYIVAGEPLAYTFDGDAYVRCGYLTKGLKLDKKMKPAYTFCPSCGAPVHLNKEMCPYCKVPYEMKEVN